MKGAPPFFSRQEIRKTLIIALIILTVGMLPSHFSLSPVKAANPTSVTIVDYAFQPAKINITTGTMVVWTYTSSGKDFHTVSSKPGTNQTQGGAPLLSSGSLSPGQTFSYTFNNPGIYPYECQFHPTIMSGWVNVTGAPVTPPPNQTAAPTDYTLAGIIGGLVAAVAGTAAIVVVARKRKRPAPSVK